MGYFSEKELLETVKKAILDIMPLAGEKQSLVESLFFVRRDNPKYCRDGFTRPMAALICQGDKIIHQAQHEFTVKPGEILITSVDVPNASGLMNVSHNNPFISVYFLLNRKIFAELVAAMPSVALIRGSRNTYPVGKASTAFLETIYRLIMVANKPQDAAMLGPLILRELHYLLLTGSHSSFLYQLYMRGSADNQIVEAISWLKTHLNRPISMEELAKKVFMSISSLHRHFKKVTGFSPLQYHKELRLFEAQRLMLAENARADMAAQAVGYESVTQFNREYKRRFGLPPHQDIIARRKRFSEGDNME